MVAFRGAVQREAIFQAVQQMYTEVATHPHKLFHFLTGRAACQFVGYPSVQLDAIPMTAVESFAGVGYPFAEEVIQKGGRVLDVGAGSGHGCLAGRNIGRVLRGRCGEST
jgi:arsenite methyltransferase